MTDESSEDSTQKQYQVYDSSLKGWIAQQADTILPVLLPGTAYKTTLNVELVPPAMRVDKAYKVLYHGEEHVLDVEFQSGRDRKLKSRLLVYNAKLYHEYGLPVITIVLYPFKTPVARSPLCILSRKKPILIFEFKTLPLFRLDAKEIMRQQHTCFYPLIPTMKNVDADLMQHVMEELTERYGDDKETLQQQYTWIQVLLSRTGNIKDDEKARIKERLRMFQELFEGSPLIQEIRKTSHDQGLEEGIQQGHDQGLEEGIREERERHIQHLQVLTVKAIQRRYPSLTEYAQQQVRQISNSEKLDQIMEQVLCDSDEGTIRSMLKL